MLYEHFVDYIKSSFEQIMGPDVPVRVQSVLKNNSVHLDALTILPEGQYISPSIYLNDYYRQYEEGKPLPTIVGEINSIYEANSHDCVIDMDMLLEFSYAKDHIAYKLINYDNNIELLNTVPHLRYLDLGIVFFLLMRHDVLGEATALITYEHMHMWNTDVDTLFALAKQNSCHLLPMQNMHLEDLMLSIIIEDLKEDAKVYQKQMSTDQMLSDETLTLMAQDILRQYTDHTTRPDLYVMTNKSRCYGAATILYEGALYRASQMLGDVNFYLLPSSIHEVILVREKEGTDAQILKNMVHEVNYNEVDTVDRLSDNVYYYNRDTDSLMII